MKVKDKDVKEKEKFTLSNRTKFLIYDLLENENINLKENTIEKNINIFKRSSSGNKSVLSEGNSISTDANFENDNKSIQDSNDFSINLPLRQNILEDLSNALDVDLDIFNILTLSEEKEVNNYLILVNF